MPRKTITQTSKMGKPVSHHQSVHHSTEVDSKGRKHHRVHVSTDTSYEYNGEPKTLMNELLAKRGY